MKTNPLLLLLLGAPLAGAGPEDFTNFVRQTDYETLVEWDVQVDESGTMSPPSVLSEIGSLFELWTVHNTSGDEISLDREFVSSYSPQVIMDFVTGDPYEPVARTRVDQPIQLVVRVDAPTDTGGNTNTLYQDLKVVHSGFLYPEGVLSPYELGDEPSQFSNEYSFESGGELVIDFPAATLAATDLTKTEGIEMFSIEPGKNNNGHGNNADDADVSNNGKKTQTDASGNIDDETRNGGRYIITSVLDKATLQVWPVAEASVSGIDPTKTYQTVPPLSVDLVDLYPDSTTYLRVYKGGPTANPANPIEIGSQAVVINDTIPQDRRMLVSHLDEFLLDTGSYTIEVLHETPFGIDVLNQFYPLQVDFSLSVRGTLYSQD